MTERTFPILLTYEDRRRGVSCPSSVPWKLVEPHRAQAMKNHSQTLERLAERGGLGPEELRAVVEGRGLRELLNAAHHADARWRIFERDVAWLKDWIEKSEPARPVDLLVRLDVESDGKRQYRAVVVNGVTVYRAQNYGADTYGENEADTVAKELKVALEELAAGAAGAQAIYSELLAHQREVRELRFALHTMLVKAGAVRGDLLGQEPLTNSAMLALVHDFAPKTKDVGGG
jgi:hypothetical protein